MRALAMVLVLLTGCGLYAASDDRSSCSDRCATNQSGPDTCEPGVCGGPPPCPSNAVPTTRNGCYTGRCLAVSECPLAACRTLTSEAACVARTDCAPLYRGEHCACTPTCDCEIRVYDHC